MLPSAADHPNEGRISSVLAPQTCRHGRTPGVPGPRLPSLPRFHPHLVPPLPTQRPAGIPKGAVSMQCCSIVLHTILQYCLCNTKWNDCPCAAPSWHPQRHGLYCGATLYSLVYALVHCNCPWYDRRCVMSPLRFPSPKVARYYLTPASPPQEPGTGLLHEGSASPEEDCPQVSSCAHAIVLLLARKGQILS